MIRRGEVWMIDFGPAEARPAGQAAGLRPAIVVSRDGFNDSAAPFVTVVPGTTTDRGHPMPIALEPRESGLRKRTLFQPELIGPVDKTQLLHATGRLGAARLAELEARLASYLDLA